MSRVVLGNRHATDSTDHGATRTALPRGKRATVVELDDSVPIGAAFGAITGPTGVWATHTSVTDEASGETSPQTDRAGQPVAPAWVASDNAALASIIAAHYGGIEIRDLEEPA